MCEGHKFIIVDILSAEEFHAWLKRKSGSFGVGGL